MAAVIHENKLINETSPYLLQHAHNPVDWYPWGDEAFDKAKNENKPIFLSIGYSTCHWCHVMERESFEDDEVADYLNANFVSIKVDREERPDIDAVYMSVCQAMTGSGGWPLTILMTPDQKPFFAGTYFPKKRSFGRPGISELLAAAVRQWKTSPRQIYSAGSDIAKALSNQKSPVYEKQPDILPVEKAVKYFSRAFDEEYGGFGYPPKFPTPHNLMFLLRFYLFSGDKTALGMAETTLRRMYRGGIFDHVGFGFSRYSTDGKWLAPHFEKMLYDNALLTIAYLEAYRITKNPLYQEIAEKTLVYIQREMTSPEGGFYSAQDADSEGEEGLFYTFTPAEIESVLGKSDGERFCRRFGVTKEGNFEGRNILNLIDNPDYANTDAEIGNMLLRLREYRNKRTALHKDDKILTAWNALMIAAYSKAYRYTGGERYLRSAERALQFIQSKLTGQNGSLMISYRDGRAKGRGLLDDYAFLAWAYLELYEATLKVEYLDRCLAFCEKILSGFSDRNGGCFLNPSDSEALLFRPKEQYDGAMPSGNSVFAYCLERIALLTGESSWQQAADRQLAFYGAPFYEAPYAHCFALMALMQAVCPSKELVCVAKDKTEETEIAKALTGGFHPQATILLKTAENAGSLEKIAPFTAGYPVDSGRSAYYICENKSCSTPIYSLDEAVKRISEN